VPSHPGRVVEGKVAVVCSGRGFGVLVGNRLKVQGSFHHGGKILAEGIQCTRIKILELLRLVAGMIILELHDSLHVHTSPHIVLPLLSIPKLAVPSLHLF
jgi:hypothetical protein